MRTYLETLLQEKGVSQEYLFKAEEDIWGTTIISVKEIVDYICKSDREAQREAREAFIKIDFHNGDIKEFFQYITNYLYKYED
jgi:hypothetical protein|tara:strand:+ start:2803 stop:3051 length:249 start_codon:yes stop_codon:yes gene_type:complete